MFDIDYHMCIYTFSSGDTYSHHTFNQSSTKHKTCHEGNYSAFISLLQPSDDMVELFDKLLVLTSDGELSYFGPMDRSLLRTIFLDSDNVDGDKGSIADLVLEASLDKTGKREDQVKARYDTSKTAQSYTTEIAALRCNAPKGMGVQDLLPDEEYPNSFMYRFKLISGRRVKLINRNAVTWTRMLIAILFGFVIGSLFANSPNNLGGALAKVRELGKRFHIAHLLF